MRLIADSGATKADWVGISSSEARFSWHTGGLSPAHMTREDIVRVLREELMPHTAEAVDSIFFYGAGCTPGLSPVVERALAEAFPQAAVRVESDLVGAARALCGEERGIACILGTGSASCEYDGIGIVKQVPSLGYVLGDEGSGAVLGRMLVADFLKGRLPQEASEAFAAAHGITVADAVEYVYRRPLPARYLASFVPFMHEHRHAEGIRGIIATAFDAFFERNISAYDTRSLSVNFVGSVAYFFEEELREAAARAECRVVRIVRRPIEALAEYHKGR